MKNKKVILIGFTCLVIVLLGSVLYLTLSLEKANRKILDLKSYVNLVKERYQIPSGKYLSVFPENYKFSRQDAAGVIWVDLTDTLYKTYLLDSNHKNLFYWPNSSGKEIDESDKSYSLYIGIPLRPEDIGNIDPENISYVKDFFNDLVSVFQRSQFTINPNFSHMEVYGYDNYVTRDIVALQNSTGTKCEINKPEPYSFSDFSARISLGGSDQVGYNSLAFIYVSCVNSK